MLHRYLTLIDHGQVFLQTESDFSYFSAVLDRHKFSRPEREQLLIASLSVRFNSKHPGSPSQLLHKRR